MINILPEFKARGNPSTLMNFLVPIIAVILTIFTGSLIFVLMGFKPTFALYTFFISPISNSYGISELLVKATPLALIFLIFFYPIMWIWFFKVIYHFKYF